jgi:GH3 auxin-responsive promoter
MSTHAPTVPGAPHWTAAVGAALAARVAWRAQRLADRNWWRANTARLQHRTLRNLIEGAAGTEFGREHDFARIAAIGDDQEMLEAYRAAVPIADWYAFASQIARMREGGEPDVLWPGLVKAFAQTSGTTAGDKYIPVSDAMMRSNYRASLDIFAQMMNQGISLPRLCSGRSLFLGGSSDLSYNEHGVATGDLSGIVSPLIRWPISAIYSPGPKIALMSDWPAKIEAMAQLAVEQDVRMISGMPSWAMVLMKRVLELARGRGWKADRILDIWPNLEIFVHGGVKYEPFRPRISEVVTGDPAHDFNHRLELYPASEGFIAMGDRAGDLSMRLLSDIGNFYEFVPLEMIDDDAPPAFTCDAVETRQRYVVVMSTCAGLWRYVLGDVVEFDEVSGGLDGCGGTGACRLRIVGRHRHFINAFGENIIVEHIENAVARAAAETGLTVGEFSAAPVYPDATTRAGLELVIEVEYPVVVAQGSNHGTPIGAFADAFDWAIKSQNVDYETKRTDDVGMAPPTVTVVPPGTFHRWMQSRGKLGGQHKCPRCANHREIVEAVVRQ